MSGRDRTFRSRAPGGALDSYYVAQSAAVTPAGTANSTLTGLSQAVTVPGTGAVYLITIDADVETVAAGGNVNIIELLLDGVAQTAQILTGQIAVGERVCVSRTWRITGQAAGAHTFSARTRNVAAGSHYRVNNIHTTMTVQRTA